MRIGIDTGALAGPKVGVYQTTLHLIEEIKKIDKNNQYFLFNPKPGNRYFWLPLQILINKIDLFIGPSQALPYFCLCPSIVIVHDLAYEKYPDCYPDSYKKLRRLTLQVVSKATKIIAVSEVTKKDLVEIYKVEPSKIIVAYEGVAPIFIPAKTKPKKYFLYVGALKRIKNVPTLIRAFNIFRKTHPDYGLVLAGGDYWFDTEIKKTTRVKMIGFVKEKDLVKLYQEATAFVSPALYEGFGLPLIEAMASGCPVICGNTGSQPEIVGKAGILVNPKDEKALTEAMQKVASSPTYRQKLVSAGLKQAKKFSWVKFAKGVHQVALFFTR